VCMCVTSYLSACHHFFHSTPWLLFSFLTLLRSLTHSMFSIFDFFPLLVIYHIRAGEIFLAFPRQQTMIFHSAWKIFYEGLETFSSKHFLLLQNNPWNSIPSLFLILIFFVANSIWLIEFMTFENWYH
jgi:hypothetical protein